MGISEIISSLAMLFMLMVPGWLFQRTNRITNSQTKILSALITKLTLPALVIDAMQIDFSIEILKSSFFIQSFVLLILAIAMGIAWAFSRFLRLNAVESRIFMFMQVFSNTGFVGIPIIAVLFGKEALFYASIIEMVNDVLLFTLGVAIVQNAAGVKTKLSYRDFLSPGLLSILIGYLLFLGDIRLPVFLGSAVKMAGNATTPLSMFIIGVQLGGIQMRELFGDFRIYVVCLCRLLLIPAIAFFILRILLKDTSLLSCVLILMSATPAAVCTAIFAEEYNLDTTFATKGILLSTVFCVITIPLFALLVT